VEKFYKGDKKKERNMRKKEKRKKAGKSEIKV
jgi:hypothetical protein